jgi:hypothetical protein
LLGVAHHIRHGINRRRPPNQIEDIAKLQAGFRAGNQFDARTVNGRSPRHSALYLQIAYFLAQNLLVGDHNTLNAHVGSARGERGIHLLTNHQPRVVQIPGCPTRCSKSPAE